MRDVHAQLNVRRHVHRRVFTCNFDVIALADHVYCFIFLEAIRRFHRKEGLAVYIVKAGKDLGQFDGIVFIAVILVGIGFNPFRQVFKNPYGSDIFLRNFLVQNNPVDHFHPVGPELPLHAQTRGPQFFRQFAFPVDGQSQD